MHECDRLTARRGPGWRHMRAPWRDPSGWIGRRVVAVPRARGWVDLCLLAVLLVPGPGTGQQPGLSDAPASAAAGVALTSRPTRDSSEGGSWWVVVEVPAGTEAGASLQIMPGGELLTVQVPDGVGPGDSFKSTVPPDPLYELHGNVTGAESGATLSSSSRVRFGAQFVPVPRLFDSADEYDKASNRSYYEYDSVQQQRVRVNATNSSQQLSQVNISAEAIRKRGPPKMSAAALVEIHRKFLTKKVDEVERTIKSNEAQQIDHVIASFDAAHLPPTDYYVCVEKYARQMAKNAHTPFIHSLCTWWAQSSLEEGALRPEAGFKASRRLMCEQIANRRQCFRFVSDPFTKMPAVKDFQRQCEHDCIGKVLSDPDARRANGGRQSRDWGARDL